MKNSFIYVFDSQTRDSLISLGYSLLKSDENSGVYIFQNKDTLSFSLDNSKFIYSDTLTF